jgi:hypothetical protein
MHSTNEEQVWIRDPVKPDDAPTEFRFDFCFDSFNPSSTNFVNQEKVFDAVGVSLYQSPHDACIF